MIALKRKSNLLRSAFFVLALGLTVPAMARVDCFAQNDALNVSRNDVASGNGGAQKSFAIPGSQSSLIINGNVDLNINSDIGGFSHGIVTKTTNFVWRVDVVLDGNNNDYITADYQFNGLVSGDNKICSSPISCINVTSISPVSTQREGIFFFGFIRIGTRTRESIQLTLDLTEARDSGIYSGNLQVELFRGSDPGGADGVPLNCD
jgi:hypothetical protein